MLAGRRGGRRSYGSRTTALTSPTRYHFFKTTLLNLHNSLGNLAGVAGRQLPPQHPSAVRHLRVRHRHPHPRSHHAGKAGTSNVQYSSTSALCLTVAEIPVFSPFCGFSGCGKKVFSASVCSQMLRVRNEVLSVSVGPSGNVTWERLCYR